MVLGPLLATVHAEHILALLAEVMITQGGPFQDLVAVGAHLVKNRGVKGD